MDEKLKDIIALWIIKADNDFRIVEQNINLSDPVTDVLAFHCQQGAEKYLKLFLVSKGVEPRKTHEIGFLLGECMKVDPEFELLTDTVFLSVYAVESRYPDDFFIPTIDELRLAYAAARRVKKLVVEKLNSITG